MTESHEYMDTGALTEDAVPAEQGPIETPDSPAKADEELTGEEPSGGTVKPDSVAPEGVQFN